MSLKSFALVENGIVVNTSVADETWDSTGWIEYTAENPAGIGYTYDADKNFFLAPKPYPSWIEDGKGDWKPPIECPNDGKYYLWSEDEQNWVEA